MALILKNKYSVNKVVELIYFFEDLMTKIGYSDAGEEWQFDFLNAQLAELMRKNYESQFWLSPPNKDNTISVDAVYVSDKAYEEPLGSKNPEFPDDIKVNLPRLANRLKLCPDFVIFY